MPSIKTEKCLGLEFLGYEEEGEVVVLWGKVFDLEIVQKAHFRCIYLSWSLETKSKHWYALNLGVEILSQNIYEFYKSFIQIFC